MIELLGRRIGGAIVLGSALIAFGLYAGAGDEAPKYQGFAADGEVFRLNTDSGTLIACNGQRCARILQRGQDLDEDQANGLFERTAPPAATIPAPQQGGPSAAPAQLPPPQR